MVEATMLLYRVTYDGQPYHVEAPSFGAAIEAWRDYVKREWKEDFDGTEQPGSVCLLESNHPVIRRLKTCEEAVTENFLSDRDDTRDVAREEVR